MVYYTLYLS